jgi:very-short-patch-repair endonuclease
MPGELPIKPVIGAECTSHRVDAEIAALAARQHGVVARWQLAAIGIGRRAIGHRLERGRLHRVHTGVYAAGHSALTREGRWMAAVLAAGPGAVLSHRSGAALWGIWSSARTGIEVTAPRRLRRRSGIEAHQAILAADEKMLLHGIPVTTVSRTLFDLAAVVTRRKTQRAVDEAEFLRLSDALSLDDLVHRHAGNRGAGAIRAILEDGRIGAGVTRSELEDRFLDFLDARCLPRPELNAHVEIEGRRFEVDCLWRAEGVIVELDGHASHATRTTFEGDRARDRALAAAGLRVVRLTWRQLHREPGEIECDLRRLLSLPTAAPNRAARGTVRRGRRAAGG